jgi:hypothetical protein
LNTDGKPQRDERGLFAPGNKIAVGHRDPQASAVSRLRKALLAAVTDDDVAEVMRALVAEAKGGNVYAIHEFFDRVTGKAEAAKPEQRDDIAETLRELWYSIREDGIEDAQFRELPEPRPTEPGTELEP